MACIKVKYFNVSMYITSLTRFHIALKTKITSDITQQFPATKGHGIPFLHLLKNDNKTSSCREERSTSESLLNRKAAISPATFINNIKSIIKKHHDTQIQELL